MQRRTSEPPALAGYQYVRLLGSGGFADVFLYDQSFPKRRVAVKVLLLDELTKESRDSFAAEANVMAQLSAHPYIVTIFQAAVAQDDRPYLVMEYCSGPSLAEQYKRQPLSVVQTLEVGVRLASAIATAHAAGILHRDIKPANVLTNQFGWPALTDFGIASTVDELAPTMTTTSRAAGTASTAGGTASVGMSIPWSPPEMFDDFPKPDSRSDVFSLAATLYTVLAGHTPFEIPGRSNGSVDLIGRIARGAITPMPRADVPASLVAILQKGMASDPSDRYSTAIEFGRALQRVEVELAYPQTPLDVPDLAIDRPERSASPDEASADETRARAIPTVRAQTAPPVAPSRTPAEIIPPQPVASLPQETVVRTAGEPGGVVEQTQLRGQSVPEGATVRRAPATPEQDAPSPADLHRPPRRRRTVVISVIVAAVLVAVVIAASAILANGAGHPTASPSQTSVGVPGGPPAGEDSGPAKPDKPTGVLASSGKSVVFSWVNPRPAKGDEYQWAPLAAGTPGTTTTVKSSMATVPYTGAMVCIRVWTVDTGDSSISDPNDGCYPG
ncbi:MAG TPA: serine/threonine-protein kinase [Galbitalea sp.]|jgi:serine/threonine protein kinase|nr:serine/threonine-protein kinase [Galbitalea sp.]